MLKKAKILTAFLWLSIFLILFSVSILHPLIYWWILFSWIFCVRQLKMNSEKSFILVFVLFIIAALGVTISQNYFSEIIMRIAFIGLIIGFIQALVEYKHSLRFKDLKQSLRDNL